MLLILYAVIMQQGGLLWQEFHVKYITATITVTADADLIQSRLKVKTHVLLQKQFVTAIQTETKRAVLTAE